MTTLSSDTTAFVAGATGHTGRHLVDELCKRAGTVIAHVRPDSPALAQWTERFESMGAEVDTTPWMQETVTRRFQACMPDVIFAMLGTTNKRAKHGVTSEIEDTYRAVDYGLTHMLIEAARTSCPGARFVYLSAYGIDRTKRHGAYAQVRVDIEDELRASGLDYVSVRPAIIGGKRDIARPLEATAGPAASAAARMLQLVGARSLAADLRTRSGSELAINCADAAQYAPSGSILTGHALDALVP